MYFSQVWDFCNPVPSQQMFTACIEMLETWDGRVGTFQEAFSPNPDASTGAYFNSQHLPECQISRGWYRAGWLCITQLFQCYVAMPICRESAWSDSGGFIPAFTHVCSPKLCMQSHLQNGFWWELWKHYCFIWCSEIFASSVFAEQLHSRFLL